MAEYEYRYWTEWSEEDGEWVGLCDGFPLVSWLEQDREAAEKGIRAVVAEAIEHLPDTGQAATGARSGMAPTVDGWPAPIAARSLPDPLGPGSLKMGVAR